MWPYHLTKANIIQYFDILFISLFTFITPIKPLVLIAGLLVFVDTIFGVFRSNKVGEKFTSRKFSSFIVKTFIYQGAILLCYVVDFYLLNELTNLFISISFLSTKLISLSIYFTEIKSLEENFKIVTGIDLWKNLKSILLRTKTVKKEMDDLTSTDV